MCLNYYKILWNLSKEQVSNKNLALELRCIVMVRWHHQLDGHEFEQAPGAGDGQGSLASCSPWGHKESDMTEKLNWTEKSKIYTRFQRSGIKKLT